MKKLFTIFSFMVFVVSAVFSQTDEEFFSFRYKPGESTPTTIIAFGTSATKYNIQYKKTGDATWLDCTPTQGTMTSDTIPNPSTADDVYDVRFRLSNTDTPKDATFDFGTDAGKLTDITQWGTKTARLNFNFASTAVETQKYASLVNISANDAVKFKALSFKNNTVFTGTSSHMDKWDVSPMTNFSTMFQNASNFNGNISNWDVSNSLNFASMFDGATIFNQDISGWNTGTATNFTSMFSKTNVFNQNIGGWDVSKGTSFNSMFSSAISFNQDIGGWDVSSATTMTNMFANDSVFNQDIGGWNVANVTNMTSMFMNAKVFNQDISGWNVANVTLMTNMFSNARAFNQDISGWNVANVTNMSSMFASAYAFNQNISGWNVEKVTNFYRMFTNATSFNQDLSAWTPKAVTQFTSNNSMANMFDNSGLSRENYDNTINGWWGKKDLLPNSVRLGAKGIKYRNCVTARQGFIDEKGWTFVDDSYDPPTGLTNTKNAAEVKLIGKTLLFGNLPATRVLVYSMSGSVVADYAPAYEINLNLDKGFYIVKVDGYSKKIVLN